MSVFPPGGQRGTDVEVVVTGLDVDELNALHFSSPAITAEPKLDAATGKPIANTFVVHLGKGLRPAAYDVRAAGKFGVTNPRAFVVDREPQSVAKPGNASPMTAFDIALNAGVYSISPAPTTSQFFRINLKANRRVMAEIDANEIDSKLDPVLVVYDAAGRELARDGQGGTIEFTPASDGAYVVEVRDVLYRGGPEFFYRLRVHDKPHVEFVLPSAAREGEIAQFTLFGRGLPAGAKPGDGGLEQFALTTPAFAGEDADDLSDLTARWIVRPPAAMLDGSQLYAFAGAVNPLFIARAPAPLVAEQADNDDPAKAQKISLPVELYGQFFPRGDRDWFTFDAKKGDALWVEATSNRLVTTTDPLVLVQRVTRDAKGVEQVADVKESNDPENIAGAPVEFPASHRDPAFRLAIPDDGTYRVLIRDLFNEGQPDPRRVYRLSIGPANEREDFRLIAWPKPSQAPAVAPAPATTVLWGSTLRPGGAMPVSVLAVRSGGFGGDIVLTAEGLPSGVTCPPVTMTAANNFATLLLMADEKSPPFVGAIRIVGKTKSGATSATPVSRAARAGTVVLANADPTNEPFRSRVAQQLVIAVTSEPDPISIQTVEQKVWEDSIAGKIEIPLKLTRRLGYNNVVKIKPSGPVPQIAALPEFDVAANSPDGKLVLDIGAMALPPGAYSLYLQGTSTAPYDRFPAQFAAANAAKAAADKATPELAAVVQKAKEGLAAIQAAKKPQPEIDAAQKAVTAAEEKVKQNEAAKVAVAEQIKALTPKDVVAYGYSPPISLKITPAPITLALTPPATPLKPGAKVDVPVTITRLYGFADAVDLSAILPQGVAGLSVANAQIPATATAGSISIQAAPDAKPGDYTLTFSATLKQNARPVKVDQLIPVKIIAP